ncbi:hypothetical protein BCR42DRAFT_372226 [Absidia repens]|uniref:Uncharacterized protein n=1 Tax=Absidia repens TaxID=90262 RepID=A0A1X2ILM7_9FUNG|nr:hypothetical protein BCR42DRAFT_372226 [Absidia repens]
MSTYESKATNRKGNNSKKGQAHQNTTAWKPNKNSKKTREINALPVYGLCQRCTDVILWRKKYRKYKPLTSVKKCVGCEQKNIKEAYHVLCNNCATEKKVCGKCLESKEIITDKEEIKSAADELKDEQELDRMLGKMTLRQRRSYMRKLERGDDVQDINEDDLDNFVFSDDEDDYDSDQDNNKGE